jgi:transposase-like protein
MTLSKSSDTHSRKSKTRMRARIDRHRREAILDEFERSGLSGFAFAKRHGIKYSTFTSWVRKRRRHGSEPAGSNSAMPPAAFPLAEVVLEGHSPSHQDWRPHPGLRLHLPGGAWLQLDGEEQRTLLAAQLLKTLQA